MKNLCDSGNCPHGKSRETCSELCAEAEKYANMDYVGAQQAFKISAARKWQFRVPVNPEDKAKEAVLLHRQGKSYEDISIHLECDEDFIREVLEDEM